MLWAMGVALSPTLSRKREREQAGAVSRLACRLMTSRARERQREPGIATAFPRADGLLPSPACGRGAGERATRPNRLQRIQHEKFNRQVKRGNAGHGKHGAVIDGGGFFGLGGHALSHLHVEQWTAIDGWRSPGNVPCQGDRCGTVVWLSPCLPARLREARREYGMCGRPWPDARQSRKRRRTRVPPQHAGHAGKGRCGAGRFAFGREFEGRKIGQTQERMAGFRWSVCSIGPEKRGESRASIP